jgi:signal transduction histidine kinase
MLRSPVSDAAECRRLAELLHLDAVGVVRLEDGHRRTASWIRPGTEVPTLDRILAGTAPGWITCPRDADVVFARLTDDSSVRSVAALSAMLGSLAGDGATEPVVDVGGVAPDDPNERERTRLAYAIHDGLTQVVTAMVLELEWQARRVDVTPQDAVTALTTAGLELRKALDEIRGVLAGLSPHTGAEGRPLETLVQDVMERWQLPAAWTIDGDLTAVPEAVLSVASSVIRESVANAAKHASSDDVAVRVHATRGAVEVLVEDRGRGFLASGTGLHAGHLGLEMLRRRVQEVHGTLDIESSPGKGTRVVARLPVMEQGVNS